MKLFLLTVALVATVANATDVNPTCALKTRLGNEGTDLVKATLSDSNNTCIADTAATCYLRTGKKHFCDVDDTCNANCDSCTGFYKEGAATSNSTNTCLAETAFTCAATTGTKHFCDVDDSCNADCNSCAGFNKEASLSKTYTGLASTASPAASANAVFTIVTDGTGAVTGVTVTTAGDGYEANDVITVAAGVLPGSSTALTFTVVADDLNTAALKTDADALLPSITNNTTTLTGDTTCLADDAASCFATSSTKHFCPGTGSSVKACAADCNSCVGLTKEGAASSDSNNTCTADDAASCFALSGTKHFCPGTGNSVKACAADCDSCIGLTKEGAATSDSTNTCTADDAASCYLQSSKKHFCDISGYEQCVAGCDDCVHPTTPANNKTKPGAATSNTTNTCAVNDAAACFLTGKKNFCPASKSCQSNCDGEEPPANVSPAGVNAPGVLATLLAAIALRM